MKRISDEDGFNAGVRNWGRLALFAIPAVLGVAALLWLGAYIEAHNFRKQLSQEDRAAIFVGAWQRPKDKVKIITPDVTCLKVTHVDLDDDYAMVYFQNNCGKKIVYSTRAYCQQIAPDGTLLHGGYDWTNNATIRPGEQAEGKIYVKRDDRAASMRFWVEGESN